ncbi:MAG TPA: hypothetical protein VMW35_05445, partial [Myxococcota bacterium]|nr:hypothetical protein [Myxococcota bacterium]
PRAGGCCQSNLALANRAFDNGGGGIVLAPGLTSKNVVSGNGDPSQGTSAGDNLCNRVLC